MIPSGKREEGELEGGQKALRAEEAPRSVGKWYRGDLNGAYQKWRESGQSADETLPVTKRLLFEIHLFVSRMMSKAARSSRVLNDERLAHIEEANKRDIRQAMLLHDPNRQGGASITTYIKRAVLNNIRDELRRVPTHQAEFLRAYGGDLEAADSWIDLTRNRREHTKNELKLVRHPVNIDFRDRSLAHWLLRQHPNTKITWRHVLRRFPKYRSEDTAGRALRRVKEAIERAGLYPEQRKRSRRR